MQEASGYLLTIAFALYLVATLFFGASIRQKKAVAIKNSAKVANIGFVITIIGCISQITSFILRWIVGGYAPVSNMYEFTTFFGLMFIIAFIILFFIYRLSVIGMFTLPLVVLMIGFASMFSRDITPLAPSLKSNFLQIHVMLSALGQGILAVSFVIAIIYLVKVVDQNIKSKKTFWLEAVLFTLFVTAGFIIATLSFTTAGRYAAVFQIDNGEKYIEYRMPIILGPTDGVLVSETGSDSFIETPSFIGDVVDSNKINTFIWSFIFGAILYILVRLITRKRFAAILQPFTKNIRADLLDEICYRSVLIGYPIFTLGALIFGMIWAQIAWGSFWSWDPKEVWALVSWLFYSSFLHLRLSRNWQGEKSAWLVIVGFGLIIFNLVFVNFLLAGLHSYAG
ncbi:c-type cytochrome biogenesis protein CcsB [Lysinibacillus sp. NPDC048646]|uniref:c-type cytochrome biogenesis protein CcsB n=1 Tax=Lysinibacillus sp. NPDC048646 TaxID=3390574 RepID=UPI003D08DC4C